MTHSRAFRLVRVLAHTFCVGLAAVGCGAAQLPQCKGAEAITLHVHPANNLNPDRTGLPRSVVVRFYQLGDPRAFKDGSFDRVWPGGAEGASAPEELIALPGRNQAHTLRRDPAARYLAVAANFRERGGDSHWRALVRLPDAQSSCERWPSEGAAPIELRLADYALHLH